MNLKSAFSLLRLSVRPTFKDKEKEFDEVLEQHKKDIVVDNSTDL